MLRVTLKVVDDSLVKPATVTPLADAPDTPSMKTSLFSLKRVPLKITST
jgi:hypothetical protein